MNKIIHNVLYDTDTAELTDIQFFPFDDDWENYFGHIVSLYRKTTGEYFLYIEAPETCLIVPINEDVAQRWQTLYVPSFDTLSKLYRCMFPYKKVSNPVFVSKNHLDNAHLLVRCDFSDEDDDLYHIVELYHNDANQYFFHVELEDGYEISDTVEHISEDRAKSWAEEFLTGHNYMEIFGKVSE